MREGGHQQALTAIHQLVAGFAPGDAISNEVVTIQSVFRAWGCPSDIFCEARRIHSSLRKEARDVRQYVLEARPEDVMLLHLSIGSMINEIFPTLPCRKAILYHNVTPSHYFQVVQPKIAYDLAKGAKQVQALAGTAAVNMADSRFNADELSRVGYRDVKVLPMLLDPAMLGAPPDRRIVRSLDDGLVNVLVVGRCAPNKRLEDALGVFSCFQKSVEPNSRFIHVGSYAGVERYYRFLVSMSRDMRLRDVRFTGSVPQAELNGYYKAADLLLCMSEHEGVCVPLLEGMWHGVPVVAHAAAAVPETLDGAGCLIRTGDYRLVAEMMGQLVRNAALRKAVVEEQRRRVKRHMDRDLASELRAHLEPLLNPDGGNPG